MEIKFNLSKYHRKEDDPLFKDGKLCLYTDTKSEDYPDEVVNTFADTLIDYYHLHSLDKIAERMNKFKLHSLNIEINNHLSISFAEIDRYVYVYEEYDMYTDTKIELTEEQKECNVLCGEFNKLFERVCDVIHRKTGFWCNRNRYSYSAYWHVAVSKYSTENITSSMGQKMLSILNGGDIFTIRFENENGELFLPTFEPISVEYDFIAPARAINLTGFNGLGFTFKKSSGEYTPYFGNPSMFLSYLERLGYTGRIVVVKQNIGDIIRLSDCIIGNSINVKYVEELNNDNVVLDDVYSEETKSIFSDALYKHIGVLNYDDEPFPSSYINPNILFDIPDGAIYREDEIFEAIKQIAKEPSEDKLLVDFKGELVTVCELLDRISEKEFLTILNIHANGLDNYTNISREYLNNGAIIYLHTGNLSGRRINKFFENNVREEKLVKFNSDELKLFIKNHPNVYAVRTARKNTNIIRVDVDDNDNRIAGFKKCDLIITSKESLQEYLHDTKNINDYNGNLSNVYNYSVNINLSTVGTDGEVVYFYDIYRHKETGIIYISLKDKPFHYPIPLNFKFD
nr:MAG TPA: hypothetical protein [Caudoviricetes sp.]